MTPGSPIRLEDVSIEAFPVAGTFTIARGSRREAVVVTVRVGDGAHSGRGECVPYARYGETVDSVVAQIEAAAAAGPLERGSINTAMPAGAARNALDVALIEIEAARRGIRAADHLGVRPPTEPRLTCYTLSLGAPDAMAEAAQAAHDMPLLKLKLGGGQTDALRLRAIRAARPDARLVADANEAWGEADLVPLLAVAREVGVELIEQPLPAGRDAALAGLAREVAICADESAHTAAGIAGLAGLYHAVNIKLDKAGGLTEALAMAEAATAAGLDIMVGCMLSTSLSMAPAWMLADRARWLDLDGPLLLAADRKPPVIYANGTMLPPPLGLWG